MGYKFNPTTGALDLDSPHKRAATLTVAAADAKDRANADYVCDGTDDHVQINAAITALPDGGGVVYLSEGTFTLGAAVVLDSNVALVGSGAGTIVKLGDALTINGITADTKSNLLIANLKVDGNRANQTTGGSELLQNGIYLVACANSKVSNCWAVNCFGSGINLSGNNTYCTVGYNYLENNNRNGLYLNFSENNHNAIVGNVAYNNDFHGFAISQSRYNAITANTAISNGHSGFSIDGAATGNSVTGNTAHSNGWRGMVFEAEVAGAYPSFCTISSNTCAYNNKEGIAITGASDNLVIGNTVYNNSQEGANLYDGIRLAEGYVSTHPNRNRITNNVIDTNHGYGVIVADASATGNVVVNNDIRNNTVVYSDSPGNTVFFGNSAIADNQIAGPLNTTGTVNVQPTGFNAVAYEAQTPGEDYPRLQITNRGDILLGPGDAALDTDITRAGAGVVNFGGAIQVEGSANFFGTSSNVGFGFFDNGTLAGELQYSVANDEFFFDIRNVGSGANLNVFGAIHNNFVKVIRFMGFDAAGIVQVGGGFTIQSGKLVVDQDSTTGAIPVLLLDQADVSEEMIEFTSTEGTGNAIEAAGAKTLTTTHFIKVTINGQTRYIPAGTIA